MTRTRKLRILEFLLIGVVMGFLEDLIAVTLATDAQINFQIVWIILAVAVPFAFISEVVVDNPRFWERFFPDKDQGT